MAISDGYQFTANTTLKATYEKQWENATRVKVNVISTANAAISGTYDFKEIYAVSAGIKVTHNIDSDTIYFTSSVTPLKVVFVPVAGTRVGQTIGESYALINGVMYPTFRVGGNAVLGNISTNKPDGIAEINVELRA